MSSANKACHLMHWCLKIDDSVGIAMHGLAWEGNSMRMMTRLMRPLFSDTSNRSVIDAFFGNDVAFVVRMWGIQQFR